MRYVGIALLAVLCLAVLLSLAFGMEWFGIKWKGFFGPKHEAVRREVFLKTRSYNEAKLQELTKYRFEYMRAGTEGERKAIASAVRLAFAEYNESRLPPELADFLRTCKYGDKESWR